MPTADAQGRYPDLANELPEAFQDCRIVIIKVAQRSAQHNCVWTKFFDGLSQRRQVGDSRMRDPDQPANVADDILQRQRSNLPFAIQMRSDLRTPILARDLGQIIFVAQQVIDYQDPCLFDLFLDRFETTKTTLVEREGRVLGRVEVLRFVGLNLVGLLDHLWVSAKTLSAELINSRY